ncbi:MAG: YdeI/OmpD-associated family protein [Gracilimonas sp.]|uniref:YdeI/OmpD-associated family protein n=1 Tax=Gracilimonas TaxID=649462 RepID=UPI001B2D13CD|nr:YdeI/OmpD-associated family protein [Gracilimonas sp.]MBO6587252.1 YdeI/OmpD-associated family protein [Gracilimonas sp.]MBO6614260.1 YdeI/OmpD-associated family protein [Gracilimonas sp.]
MKRKEKSGLSRDIYPMPDFVEDALKEHQLLELYYERPAYQQNDYIGWISRAKQEKTRLKRLNQMLDELRKGGLYMKMDYPASRHKT